MNNLISQLGRYLVRVLSLTFGNNNFVGLLTAGCVAAMRWCDCLMAVALRLCLYLEIFFRCVRRRAFVLLLFPDRVCFSFSPLFRGLQLIIGVIGVFKLFKVLHKENLLERLHPAGKLFYLWFDGVSPPDLA
ncbi:hypothetical protein ABDJ41_19850 [Pedobacter sp. ASV1-7]|uniref:hypothetical protein n=1 Tax=Pedobacter sp. ASV1-7 TaxID=3145237 RepID=UPI0032E929BF